MSRLAILLGLAVLAGCTTPPTSAPSNLQDPEAMALVSPLLFITSTSTDELRVLSLDPDPSNEFYIEAPNPIYVLSIPVVSRPFAMATDTNGSTPGSFIFVLSAVEDRLGIVDSNNDAGDPSSLTEVQEVALPGTPRSVAAWTDPDGSGGARVYVGLANGTHGSVAVVDVPNLAQLPVPGLVVNSTFADLGTADPAAMAISPDGTTLSIADQLADEWNPDPAQRRGGLIQLDISDPTAAQSGALSRVMVGGPALKLTYSPASVEFIDGGGGDIPAGQYLYVVLSNTGCELGQPCGGVQVVENGQVPESSPGVPWEPMVVPGQATDVSPGAGPFLNLPQQAGMGGLIRSAILLAIPSTNGEIYFADGVEGRVYNVDYMLPNVTTLILHVDASGNPVFFIDGGYAPADGGQYDGTGPDAVQLSLGAVESGTIQVQYAGTLPVLSARPAVTDDAGLVLTDPLAVFQDLGVETSDWVLFASQNPACAAPLLDVAAVGSLDGGLAPNQLLLTQSLPPGCIGDPTLTYTVAASPQSPDPYVVVSSVAGYLGRTRPNTAFFSQPSYFYRPPGYNPTAPGLGFEMGTGATPAEDGGPPAPGQAWVFNVDSAVEPMSILGGVNGLIPGPAVFDTGLSSYFVGYPGSNLTSEVIQFDPQTVVFDTDSNITEWE